VHSSSLFQISEEFENSKQLQNKSTIMIKFLLCIILLIPLTFAYTEIKQTEEYECREPFLPANMTQVSSKYAVITFTAGGAPYGFVAMTPLVNNIDVFQFNITEAATFNGLPLDQRDAYLNNVTWQTESVKINHEGNNVFGSVSYSFTSKLCAIRLNTNMIIGVARNIKPGMGSLECGAGGILFGIIFLYVILPTILLCCIVGIIFCLIIAIVACVYKLAKSKQYAYV
jgi:hypothetical protein